MSTGYNMAKEYNSYQGKIGTDCMNYEWDNSTNKMGCGCFFRLFVASFFASASLRVKSLRFECRQYSRIRWIVSDHLTVKKWGKWVKIFKWIRQKCSYLQFCSALVLGCPHVVLIGGVLWVVRPWQAHIVGCNKGPWSFDEILAQGSSQLKHDDHQVDEALESFVDVLQNIRNFWIERDEGSGLMS